MHASCCRFQVGKPLVAHRKALLQVYATASGVCNCKCGQLHSCRCMRPISPSHRKLLLFSVLCQRFPTASCQRDGDPVVDCLTASPHSDEGRLMAPLPAGSWADVCQSQPAAASALEPTAGCLRGATEACNCCDASTAHVLRQSCN